MKYGKFWSVILISVSVGLVGCGNTDTISKNADLPDTIYLNDLSVRCGATEIPEEFWDAGVDFEVDDDNTIRCITIENPEVETYKGITVGDSGNKVKSNFDNEMEVGSKYFVQMVGLDELGQDADYSTVPGDSICLQYDIVDDKVERILIYDYNYAKYGGLYGTSQ